MDAIKFKILSDLLKTTSREEIIQALDQLEKAKNYHAPTRKTLETVEVGDFAFARDKFSTNPCEFPHLLGVVGCVYPAKKDSKGRHGLIVTLKKEHLSWGAAIAYCRSYINYGISPGEGVLGSSKQWSDILKNAEKINPMLKMVAADPLQGWYWTSSFSPESPENAECINVTKRNIGLYNKTYEFWVRCVLTF